MMNPLPLLLLGAAWGQTPQVCLPPPNTVFDPPATLVELVKCHRRRESEFIRAYEKANKRPFPDDEMERLLELQAEEVRVYLGDRGGLPKPPAPAPAQQKRPAPLPPAAKAEPKTPPAPKGGEDMSPDMRSFLEAVEKEKEVKHGDDLDSFSQDPEDLTKNPPRKSK